MPLGIFLWINCDRITPSECTTVHFQTMKNSNPQCSDANLTSQKVNKIKKANSTQPIMQNKTRGETMSYKPRAAKA